MMKKIFSFMLLCTALVIASCGNDDDTTPVAVSGVTLDNPTLLISVGETGTLKATVAPEDATDKSVTWSSDKTNIATVKDGVVTAVAEGTANITATSVADNTKKATCVVTVKISYITVNNIKVAVGNLVADGPNGAKIGTSTDVGLYFQFGSLIGWSNSGAPAIVVKPVAFNGSADWTDSGKVWQGQTGVVPFTATGSDEEKAGIGDPCRYYLKGTWRLPTKDEFVTIFSNTTSGWNGATGWSWTGSSTIHTSGLTFLAPGGRQAGNNELIPSGRGFYWSASPSDALGHNLIFYQTTIVPSDKANRRFGYSIRCIRD